jgi:hypothetical protein
MRKMGGHVRGLDETAHLFGAVWAKRTLSQFEGRRVPIPIDWPGKLEDARRLLYCYLPEQIDGEARERLAIRVQEMAKGMWRDFLPPN